MKLWSNTNSTHQKIEAFSIGQDQTLDLQLAKHDVIGSIAHAVMLAEVKLISDHEKIKLVAALKDTLEEINAENFSIQENIEDIHSQIELTLTENLGDIGKKIHTARSRNDQVLLDLRLFFRAEITQIVELIKNLFETLQSLSEQHQKVLIPGYTHLQMAMVSSFGLWFGAFAESLIEDLQLLLAVYKNINKNPLGSAAGYGTSLPINRSLTTQLLGFDDLSYNVVHAQMGRGKTELHLSFAMASLGNTIGKLATDICLYMNPGFGYLSLPDNFTTGSSIMPHKKNPDIFELIRGRCNQLNALPSTISMLIANLPSGYHRDFQILKESVFPAIQHLKMVLELTTLGLTNIEVNIHSLDFDKHQLLFTVEAVNDLVVSGVPFREAYHIIAEQVKHNEFKYTKEIQHIHEGSVGNLCNAQIQSKFKNIYDQFNFSKYQVAIQALIK